MVDYKEVELKNGKVIEKEVYTKKQSELTADCWIVQFKGLFACKECEEYCKKDCGGGKTLLNILVSEIEKTGIKIDNVLSIMERHFIAESIEKELSFYDTCKYKMIWRLKKVYQKYVNIAYRNKQDLDRQKDNEYTPLNELYPFFDILEKGKIISKGGYHQGFSCTCKNTTSKGSYKDIVIEYDNKTLYYYHQNCIMIKEGNSYILDNCGFLTVTTKDRLCEYMPDNYFIFQKQYKWYIADRSKQYPWNKDNRIDFYNGIELKG